MARLDEEQDLGRSKEHAYWSAQLVDKALSTLSVGIHAIWPCIQYSMILPKYVKPPQCLFDSILSRSPPATQKVYRIFLIFTPYSRRLSRVSQHTRASSQI